MLHDSSYLQDKSVKKVSVATLKRRQNMMNQPSVAAAPGGQKSDYTNVKPSANL